MAGRELGAAVVVCDGSGRLQPSAVARIERQAAAATVHLQARGEVRVRIVSDPEMAAAHERFAGVPGTTDVLTFDLRDEAPRPGGAGAAAPLDVDIYACLDEAERQAAARGHAVEHELLLYIVHGVLHCLGHDDHDDAAYQRMHALEDQVLSAIGIGPVFGRAGMEGGRG